jgi:hypothetical protein
MNRPEKPGLYEDVQFEDYLKWEAVSRSELVALAISPAEYRRYKAEGITPTEAMNRGSAVDLLLFEGPAALAREFVGVPQRMDELPDNFIEAPEGYAPTRLEKNGGHKGWKLEQQAAGKVIVPPTAWKAGGLDMATTAGKKFKEHCESAGVQMLSGAVMRQIHECAEAARQSKMGRRYLGLSPEGVADGYLHQPSILWQDHETGLWCKARPDAMRLLDIECDLGDLKVPTVDVRPPELGGNYWRHIWDSKLHWQAGWYTWGVREATGWACDTMNLVAVQATGVHRVEHHGLRGEEVEQGEAECRAQLHLLKWCQDNDSWAKESEQENWVSFTRYQKG